MVLSKEQSNHLKRILKDTDHELAEKYKKGAAEHKSTLSVSYTVEQLVDMAFEEALDMVTYIHTIREKLRELMEEK